jgi:hypothetical protein
MALPLNYHPRKGDILILHVTVQHDVDEDENKAFVLIPPNKYNVEIVPLDSFIGIRRRTWEPGDQVQHRNIANCFGTVVAMDGDTVWVKLAEGSARTKRTAGGYMTVHCNEIEPTPYLQIREQYMTFEEPPPEPLSAEGFVADEETPGQEKPL